MSADYVFPDDAACGGHRQPELWDEAVADETAAAKKLRHAAALAICERCPVMESCRESIDLRYDEGIRGGLELGRLDDPSRKHMGGYGAMPGIVRKRWRANRAS